MGGAGDVDRPALPLRGPGSAADATRGYFVQQCFHLSDPTAEDALYDSEAMRRFVGLELADDAIPDETTILRFRQLLVATSFSSRSLP